MRLQDNRKTVPEKRAARGSFVTIDDVTRMARELLNGLKKLSESKHPLDIRRGIGKGVIIVANKDKNSKILKAGSKTYFFDIKQTKDGKSFLVITESRFKSEGKDRERSAIMVFPENAKEFADLVAEMTTKLG